MAVTAACAALLTACAPAAAPPSGSSIGGAFHLVDQDGRPTDEGLLRGKWSLVYFGYTFCPDACPATLSNLSNALDKLGPRAQSVQVVFITVDPHRDTPRQLKTYLASPSFPKRLIGLTGTDTEIANAARAYHVYFHQAGTGATYSVDHTSVVYLMAPDGRFSKPIGFGEPPADVARDIATAMSGV
jgi:protein SCO1/2